MDERDFDGTLVLEQLATIGKVDAFFDAIDSDDVGRAVSLILRRLHRNDEAGEAYRRALPLTQNEQVRRFIEQRLHDGFN
jgi:predicted RNA polymerase sigma factor